MNTFAKLTTADTVMTDVPQSQGATGPPCDVHSEQQFKMRSIRHGGLHILTGASGLASGAVEASAFRAAPETVGILISDGQLPVLEEDFKHICSQAGASMAPQLQAWIAHQLEEDGGPSFLLAVVCHRRSHLSGRLHWYAGGIEARAELPTGWRGLLHRIPPWRFWRLKLKAGRGHWRLNPRSPWTLSARLLRVRDSRVWMRVEMI